MKITRIRVVNESLDLLRPYTIAYRTISQVSNCFVFVETDSGLTGIGAANPSPMVVGESLADTLAALSPEGVAPFLGRDPRELPALCREVVQRFPDQPGARAALDIAFHDLFARYLGLPLVRYLGQQHQALPTSITIGILDLAETLAEAEEYQGRGFRILKVKLGHSLEADIERLHKLRELVGTSMGIRVDANQGYSLEELLRFVRETRDLDIELIEQPLPTDQTEALRALPESVRASLAADESLLGPAGAWRLAQGDPPFGIFNIKLMKTGGIFPALEVANIAKRAGMALMWGCNDESIVSISAALHAAFSCPHTRYIDLDGSLDLARDLVSGGFALEDGLMRPLDGAGLGFEQVD
ncbi:MAG: dipeptide epimerase [Bacteroidetes bacterium]|nr:MAG: dipeptide epimerase [Bacteroidota bacterium]